MDKRAQINSENRVDRAIRGTNLFADATYKANREIFGICFHFWKQVVHPNHLRNSDFNAYPGTWVRHASEGETSRKF